jgi:hypothetical protein
MAIVETMPISGVVRLAIIAGPAMAKTCAVVTLASELNECGLSADLYRPRGAPNSRDNSQTGITITAPSRK